MDDIFLCHECGRVFYKLSSLESHVKWKHNDKTTEFMCDQCGRTFQKKYNLLKHIEVGVHFVAETVRCAAEQCDFRAPNRKSMSSHYENYHGISLTETTVYFTTIEDFFNWKTEYENQTRARFVKMSSSRRRKNGIIKSTYLCHRDGNFIPKGKNIRLMKGKGSNKINAHCPAKMEVDISEKLVTATFIDTHVGHDLDVTRLSLNQADKALIAEKLAMQVPFEEILEEINSAVKDSSDCDDVNRLNLLTRKDLWNIVDTFKIDPKSVVYSKNRAKKNSKIEEPKKETSGSHYWLKNLEVLKQDSLDTEENEIVCDTIMENDASEEKDEKVLVYPLVVEGENNNLIEEYAVVSDDHVLDEECLFINAQGELESINGHQVVYTEDGKIQIIKSEAVHDDSESNEINDNVLVIPNTNKNEGEIKILNEEEINICEMKAGEIVFLRNGNFDIENPSDNQEDSQLGVKVCDVKTLLEKTESKATQESDQTETVYFENYEESEHMQTLLVEEGSNLENQELYSLTDPDFEGNPANEFVIISTEDELGDCKEISTEEIGSDENASYIFKSEISSEDSIFVEECVTIDEQIKPQWPEKRKNVLSKLLNVQSMVNNEKQFKVVTKNIVLNALLKNEEQGLSDSSSDL